MLRFLRPSLLFSHHNRVGCTFILASLTTILLLPVKAVAVEADTVQAPVSQVEAPSPRVMQLWVSSCALCHVDGNAGAPVIGDREAWLPRQKQGEAMLLQHTVEGFNDMPPLGYCMACEREDFLNLIRLMTGGATKSDATP